jgi:rubredoxin
MTREAAIKELKEDIELYIPLHGTIDDVDRDLPDGRLITALEMAIEALEQEPCEGVISRQAVLDEISDYNNDLDYTTNELYDRIKRMPSVNPQPKTGHWIAQDIHNCHTDFKCSECGYIHSFMHLYGKPTADYTYCPICGAKMVESQERSDKV